MKVRIGLVSFCALTLVATAVTSAGAEQPVAGSSMSLRAGGAVCTASVHRPHRSSGAADGRILFKTTVACEVMTYPSITVNIKGSLERGPKVGPKYVAATSNESQVLKKGGKVTFYTPTVGGSQVKAPGEYTGVITGKITAPVPGTIAGTRSATVKL